MNLPRGTACTSTVVPLPRTVGRFECVLNQERPIGGHIIERKGATFAACSEGMDLDILQLVLADAI